MTVEFFGCKNFDAKDKICDISMAVDGFRLHAVMNGYRVTFTTSEEDSESPVEGNGYLEKCCLYYFQKCWELKRKVPDVGLETYYLKLEEKDSYRMSAVLMTLAAADIYGTSKPKTVIRKKMKGKKKNNKRQ